VGFFYLGRKDFFRAREYFALYIEAEENAGYAETDNPKKRKAKAVVKEIDDNGLGDENFCEAYKLVTQGKEEAGMNYIREFIEQHPTVWNGWFVLGWALRRTGRWKDGIAAFNKAVELGGGNSDTRNELAICLMETGDLKGARHELESALHDDPENIKIISNMGVLALKNDNRAEAAAFFRTVLELDPDDPVAGNFFDKDLTQRHKGTKNTKEEEKGIL
jgi:Flp pilus assembly protein TadD